MNLKRITGLVLLVVGLSAITAIDTGAKGPSEFVELRVPGMYRRIRIEMPTVPADLNMGQFEDFRSPVDGPDNVGPGLMITRGWFDDQGHPVPWDRLMFFSNLEGERGYVYYFGLENGSSEYDGRWFRVSEAGEAALIMVLDAERVHVAGLNPSANYTFGDGPSAMAANPIVEDAGVRQVASGPLALGVLAVLGAGLWWLHRSKQTS